MLRPAGRDALHNSGALPFAQTMLKSHYGQMRHCRLKQFIGLEQKVRIAGLAVALMPGRKSLVDQHAIIRHAANDVA